MRVTLAIRRQLCGTVFALGLLPAAARAGEPTVGVTYRAPRDCPDPAAFIALLATRAAERWRFRDGTGDPRFLVEIRDAGDGKLGRLRRQAGDRVSEAREVRAASCRDVAQALALSAALSLETAGGGPDTPLWIWSAGAGAAALALLPPGPMLEGRVHLEAFAARRSARSPGTPGSRGRGDRGDGLHPPDLRLTLAHARNDLRSPGAARFALSTIGLDACALSWRALRLCLGAEAGVLSAAGSAIDRPRSTWTWWAAAGVVASARWTIGRWLIAEPFAGLRAPFRRVDFLFEMPRRPVAAIPAVVVLGGVSVARTIP